MKIDGFPPPFSFCGGKKKTAVEPSKEKTPVAAQLRARDVPCRAAGCGSKRSCSVEVIPTGARAGLPSDFRAWYAVLHSSLIGQRPDLTSCYLRAFRFAKRCPGNCGSSPPRSVGRGDHTPPFLVPRRVWGRRPVGAAVRFDDRGGGPAPHPALRADTAGLARRMTCPFRGVYERRLP